MTETAKGQSQAWDASDRVGLEEPETGSIFITSRRKRKAQQGMGQQKKTSQSGDEAYGNVVCATRNREWWVIHLSRY